MDNDLEIIELIQASTDPNLNPETNPITYQSDTNSISIETNTEEASKLNSNYQLDTNEECNIEKFRDEVKYHLASLDEKIKEIDKSKNLMIENYELARLQLENNFKKIDTKINETLNKVIHIKQTFESKLNSKNKPFLNETNIDLYHMLNELDHTKFQMETQLSENFSFIKFQKCLITISCPEIDNVKQNNTNIHTMLRIDLLDSQHKKLKFSLKDKFSSYQNFIQIGFTPTRLGIHYLSILFKNNHIPNSPFHFVVLSHDMFMDSPLTANKPKIEFKKSKTANKILSKKNARTYQKPMSYSSVSADSYNQALASCNLHYNYNSQKSQIFQPHVSLNTFLDQNNNNFEYDQSGCTGGLLSYHLKKYSCLMNNISIPPILAHYRLAFKGCNLPIGLCSYDAKNWLIVCDVGSNSLKIFEKTCGDLIYEIKEQPSDGNSAFVFKRPSAAQIYDREIYVKDDKEILVFDLEDSFKFKRRFGENFLKKPYGLAFDSNGNLVLVDVNSRNPLILTFDKLTGSILNSKPFQPALPQCVDQANLYKLDSSINKIINSRLGLIPYQANRFRFIFCNQDSVYASDLGRSIVYKTSLDGEIKLLFGGYGGMLGELNEPSGLYVDNDGSAVLVADSRNDRLQVYDAYGMYKCNIDFINEQITRPSDIHVDLNGYLYVSCFIRGCVKCYKLVSN